MGNWARNVARSLDFARLVLHLSGRPLEGWQVARRAEALHRVLTGHKTFAWVGRKRLDGLVASGGCCALDVGRKRYYASPDLFRGVRGAGFALGDGVDRKVAADWLDERGRHALAGFLRTVTGVQLGGTHPDHDEVPAGQAGCHPRGL